VTVTILLDKGGAVTHPASDKGGIKEGSSGIGLISDYDYGVLQCAIPRTGEPFDSASGPPVAEMARLGKLDADWTQMVRGILEEVNIMWPLTHRGNDLDNANELIKDSLSGYVVLIDRITAGDGMESVI